MIFCPRSEAEKAQLWGFSLDSIAVWTQVYLVDITIEAVHLRIVLLISLLYFPDSVSWIDLKGDFLKFL